MARQVIIKRMNGNIEAKYSVEEFKGFLKEYYVEAMSIEEIINIHNGVLEFFNLYAELARDNRGWIANITDNERC